MAVEEILVSATPASPSFAISETHNILQPASVLRIDATSAVDVLRRLPSVHVPTNSRGESIVFLRNAGERQVATFLGGALLNVPWDNRFDMSMVPGHIVGTIATAAGPVSPRYGVNALGAVNILLPTYRDGAAFNAEWGDENLRRYDGVASGHVGASKFLVAAGHAAQDGDPLSDDAALPFFQANPDRRTNTDREILNVAARSEFETSRGTVDATLLYSDGNKGIAPESDRATGNRFWRYPEHELAQANLGASLEITPDVTFIGSAWVQDFNQTIDQYTNVTYSTVLDREEDKDRTYGTRGIIGTQVNDSSQAVLSYNVLVSTHTQRDTRLIGGTLPPALPPLFKYRQRAASVGAEFKHALNEAVSAEVGAGIDWMAYLKTGDKPAIPDFVEPTAHAGLAWSVSDTWRLRTSAGYKARTPTMRDLFGVALNRFLLNPDLTAERVLSVEAGTEWQGDNASISIIPFAQFVSKTIDQRNVGALRQRVNLRGSRILGAEISAHITLTEHVSVSGDATLSKVRRLRSTPTESKHLAEKPAVLARVAIDYIRSDGFESQLEMNHTGRAYSANTAGALTPLNTSNQLNARVAFNLDRLIGSLPPSQIYLRADNLTDTFVEPQIGLPAPGRWIRGGIKVTW